MTDIGPADDGARHGPGQPFEDRFEALMLAKRFAEVAEALRSEIAAIRDPMARLGPMDDLAMVLELNGQPADALQVMIERVELAPDEPIGWCALANRHFCDGICRTGDEAAMETALETIDRAVVVAERTGGAWLRHCLNDRARIASAAGRRDVLEDTIRRILTIPDGRGVPDTGIEIDFLRDLPPGAVDPELSERLQERHAAASQRRRARED